MPATSICLCLDDTLLPSIGLHDAASPQRPDIQAFVTERYSKIYGANISHFLPLLMASWSQEGIEGVLGLRPGLFGKFFVESYLDRSIEAIAAEANGQPVSRSRIIETGNLAGNRGSSQLMFIVLTQVLHRAGFHWATFTATAQVNGLLHRLGFNPQVVCEADPARLEDKGQSWGSYYANRPCVIIGDVRQGYATLRKNEYAQHVLSQHQAEINLIVDQLSMFCEGPFNE